MDKEKIKALAMKLTAHERAELAEDLLSSLDPKEEEEIEALWIKEAERRYEAYKRGEMSARSADEVFRDLEERFG